MDKLEDLTLISCSYNTPDVTETMIKSFKYVENQYLVHNKIRILISENSTNELTENMLIKNGIDYIRNPAFTHSEGVQSLLDNCKTKYALLVDTDIIFKLSISPLVELMENTDATLMGEVCGNRGGYNLKPRVHPWFCLINVDNIKKYKIKFTDVNRITKSNSSHFYKHVPILDNNVKIDPNISLYDVASTFYEDILFHNLKVVPYNEINKWFTHYEGTSWQTISGNQHFMDLGNKVRELYKKEYERFKYVSLEDCFNYDKGSKYALIFPVFIPNKQFLDENVKSLKSWYKSLKDIDFIIGGYFATPELKEEFLNKIEDVTNGFFYYSDFDKNYGKAYIVNKLSETYLELNKDCEYFITCDSDIILEENQNNICERLEKICKTANGIDNKDVAYLSFEQTGDCCHEHLKFNYKKDLVIDNNIETIARNTELSGIAGGALFINVNFWKEVKGYRVMGVYAGDDGFLLLDSYLLNYNVFVIETIKVEHPLRINKKYSTWKRNKLQQCKGYAVENIEINIEDANEFWQTENN